MAITADEDEYLGSWNPHSISFTLHSIVNCSEPQLSVVKSLQNFRSAQKPFILPLSYLFPYRHQIHNIQLLRPLGFFIAVLLSDSFFNIVCKITTIMCRGFIRLYLNYQRYSYMNLQLFAFYSYLQIYFSLHSVLSFSLLLVAFIFSLPCTEPLTLLQHPNCHRGSKQFYFLPLTR